MKKYLFMITLIFLLFSTTFISAENVMIRIKNADKSTADYFYSNNYDVAAFSPEKNLDIIIPEESISRLKKLGYTFEIVKTENEMKQNLRPVGRELTEYTSYDEMVDELEELAALHPEIVELIDIGDSKGKIYYESGNDNYEDYAHDIWCVKLSDNVGTEEDEPNVCFDGVHHAREVGTLEMVLAIMHHLVDNYGTDPEVTYWVENAQIWFIPLVNPDGHKIVIDEDDMWWRKNIHDNDENGQITWGNGQDYPDGVDPNRNYGPLEWFAGAGTSGSTGLTYPGTEPFSEPETSALKNLIQSHKFATAMSYHSYSELIMWPLGYSNSCVAPDNDAFEEFGEAMAATVPALYGGNYTPQQTNALYPCSGTTTDWGYGVERVFYYITELGIEFIPSYSQNEQIVENNLSAALMILDRAFNSILTGTVTDSLSGEPIVAEVTIPEIDNTGTEVEPARSGEEFGRYFRPLLPELYTVEFSAFGYETKTFEIVAVYEEGESVLDAELNPAPQTEVTIFVENADALPIENAEITFLNTPLESVVTSPDGQAVIENVPYGNYDVSVYTDEFGTFVYSAAIDENNTTLTFTIEEPIVFDGFENGLTNWDATGSWDLTNSESYSGDYSATDSPSGNYGANANYTFTYTDMIDLSNAISASVQFATKYYIEQGYDYAYFQISSQGNWTDLATYTGSQSEWNEEAFNLNAYLGQIVSFRFKFESDTYVEEDGIYIDDYKIFVSSGQGMSGNNPHENTLKLFQNFPNPFNPTSAATTKISFNLPNSSEKTSLEIFNIKGQMVNKFNIESGSNSVEWNGNDKFGNAVRSGVYLYRISNHKKTVSRKMLLMK